MKHILLHILALYLLSISSTQAYGQEKYESESRLQTSEVPSPAQTFIQSIQGSPKVRWFSEQGLDSKSIEAKFRLNSHSYSVEFDTNGLIQDVEIDIDWKKFDPTLKNTLLQTLNGMCLRFKVSKIQVQYSGATADLLSYINAREREEALTKNFELVVKCKAEKSTDLYELLFNAKGELLKSSKIIFRNSDNLEY